MAPRNRLTIVVTAYQKNAANTWVTANIDPASANSTFSSPFTNNGSTITHYVASGLWTEEQCKDLEAKYGTKAYEGDPQEVLAKQELTPFDPLS